MSSRLLRLAFLAILTASVVAKADILDRPVSLKTEGDLIQAVSITLQHAVATSEQYRGTNPRLQRFARKEISARRKPIEQLNKQLAIVPKDDASYLRAMSRNHAWLLELIEYGGGLPLSSTTKRLMETLSRDAAAEFALLSKLEKS